MLDHVTLGVTDIDRSKRFYDRALSPLGIARLYAEENVAGYDADGKAFFWIGLKGVSQTGAHAAFTAADRDAVDRFYEAALATGGRDYGAPGLRPDYHADYYAAFVLDPDGHNNEAVCRRKIG